LFFTLLNVTKRATLLLISIVLSLLTAAAVVLLFPELFFQSNGDFGPHERFLIRSVWHSRSNLIKRYNLFSHSVFFLVFFATQAHLLYQAVSRTTNPLFCLDKYTFKRAAGIALRHPLSSTIFLFYVALMVHGASYLYPEIIGWYSAIDLNYLLDNFRLNDKFIAETMRRNDFRFFPLAHQDLHLLSWITPYVKIWMLVSAIELLLILYFATKFITSFTRKSAPFIFLGAILIFLFLPSTEKAFFQFIYSERLLVLLFSIYIFTYLRYQQTLELFYLYATLSCALFGVFLKDIAFILFAGPALFTFALRLIGRYQGFPMPQALEHNRERITYHYELEFAIIALLLAFFVLYFYLSALPSLVEGSSAYGDCGQADFHALFTDVRMWAIFLFLGARTYLVTTKLAQATFLDGINASALAYMIALAILVGCKSDSYLVLPVHYITLLDFLYLWVLLYAHLRSHAAGKFHALIIFFVCVASVIALDLSKGPRDPWITVAHIKQRQASWLAAFKEIKALSRERISAGKEVNLIFSKSWFNNHRYLDELRYDRLIYLNPDDHSYVVKDGLEKGSTYLPRTGDLLFFIDDRQPRGIKDVLQKYKLIYEFDKHLPNAKIYERK